MVRRRTRLFYRLLQRGQPIDPEWIVGFFTVPTVDVYWALELLTFEIFFLLRRHGLAVNVTNVPLDDRFPRGDDGWPKIKLIINYIIIIIVPPACFAC